LVTFEQIIEYLSTSDAQDNLASMMAYRETYGAKS
jgi:hypothetical protein